MSSPRKSRVEQLNEYHDLTSFKCSEPALATFLSEKALECQREHACSVYLLVGNSDEILGFFTLSNASIYRESLSNTKAKKYKYNPIPALLIGQLARDTAYSLPGFGDVILAEAIKEALKRQEWQLLCVDPFSDYSYQWFRSREFQAFARSYPDPPVNKPVKNMKLYFRRVDLEASIASLHEL